jgi:hypothetical protein
MVSNIKQTNRLNLVIDSTLDSTQGEKEASLAKMKSRFSNPMPRVDVLHGFPDKR